jgi:hypothetical protein
MEKGFPGTGGGNTLIMKLSSTFVTAVRPRRATHVTHLHILNTETYESFYEKELGTRKESNPVCFLA